MVLSLFVVCVSVTGWGHVLVCTHMYAGVHVEAKGQHWASSSIVFHFVFGDGGPSLNPDISNKATLVGW